MVVDGGAPPAASGSRTAPAGRGSACSLGDRLMQMAEALGSSLAPVPAFQTRAADLYPLISSTNRSCRSPALLKLVIKQDRALGMALGRAERQH